ncbi:MAG: gliding motility-associated C-terminal domain-containing protein [Bacteroidota bacterium]
MFTNKVNNIVDKVSENYADFYLLSDEAIIKNPIVYKYFSISMWLIVFFIFQNTKLFTQSSCSLSYNVNNISCFGGNNGSATVTPSGGNPPYTYQWNNGQTMQTSTGLTAGTYTVNVQDKLSCNATATIIITEPPALAINILGDTLICLGQGTTLTASVLGGTLGYTYLWSPGNMTTTAISIQPSSSETYTIIITEGNVCSKQDTARVSVGIEPLADFKWVTSLSYQGINVQFLDKSTNATSWYWNFGDGTNTSQQNPRHVFPYNNTYYITLVAINPYCSDSLVDTMQVGDLNSLVAITRVNIFTPNGDGINDCFRPAITDTTADLLQQYITMEVYDRWGVKVFESTPGENCWDGRTLNNKEMITGTYYYIAKFGQSSISGFVELLR